MVTPTEPTTNALDWRPAYYHFFIMEYRDLNTFKEGQRVDINGIAEMQNLKIERISDCGVTVTGGTLTPFTVISGRSPARLHREEIVSKDANVVVALPRVSRGTYTAKMNDIKVPGDVFTIKELAEVNGIPQPYAYNWVKEHCVEAGLAARSEGQRGKTAVLYKVG